MSANVAHDSNVEDMDKIPEGVTKGVGVVQGQDQLANSVASMAMLL